jgi:hypothetical protein
MTLPVATNDESWQFGHLRLGVIGLPDHDAEEVERRESLVLCITWWDDLEQAAFQVMVRQLEQWIQTTPIKLGVASILIG